MSEEKKMTADGKVIREIIPMKGMRAIIAKRMKESKVRSPHVSGFVHMDVTPLVELKAKLADHGYKVSYTEMFTKIAAMAAGDFPLVNASHNEKDACIEVYETVNVGVAVATPTGGLIVPNVKNCEKKSLLEISAETKDIVNKIRTNKANMDMLTGGTITITSMGMFGSDGASPIINMPEAMIIGIGAIKKMPMYDKDDNIVPRHMCYVSTTFDHCVMDGVPSAQFCQRMSQIIDEAEKYLMPEWPEKK